MDRGIETLIVGGGQAGLSVSYYLTQAGREHLLLEKADTPAHVWTSDRWDSFTLVTPNWSFLLPGAEYDGPDPDGFMLRSEVVDRFNRYVAQNNPPIQYHVEATAVDSDGGEFRVQTALANGGLAMWLWRPVPSKFLRNRLSAPISRPA